MHIWKAKILERTKNFDQAIEILEKVADKKFKLDSVYFYIGFVYFVKAIHYSLEKNNKQASYEYYKKAITYYDKAIDKNPQFFDAYTEKIRTLHNLGKYSEALAVINSALVLFPEDIRLIYLRGKERICLGDFTGAMADLNTAIESKKLDSEYLAKAYRFRGLAKFEKNNFDEAIEDFTTSLKYDNSYFTLYNRASAYIRLGERDKACEDYRKAAEMGFSDAYEKIRQYCD